jgi:hypothetical protein
LHDPLEHRAPGRIGEGAHHGVDGSGFGHVNPLADTNSLVNAN